MKMKINDDLLRQMESDLSLNTLFSKGKNNPTRNCWHFCTDGNAVNSLFYDDEDFANGMNRAFVIAGKFRVVVLAFCLMDTHVHFILYGEFRECNGFLHEYLRLTSKYISAKHNEKGKLVHIPITHQFIDNDFYLKSAICYVIKNAPVGGILSNAYDYPWCSGPLYFRKKGYWSSPNWTNVTPDNQLALGKLGVREKRKFLRTRDVDIPDDTMITGNIVFPGEYVAYEIVERIFKTPKSFNYFMCKTKEEDIESRGGAISRLSIPIQEMRQYRNEICMELFGKAPVRTLSIENRLRLARTIKSRYNSSLKQICRLCGLVYDEAKCFL